MFDPRSFSTASFDPRSWGGLAALVRAVRQLFAVTKQTVIYVTMKAADITVNKRAR